MKRDCYVGTRSLKKIQLLPKGIVLLNRVGDAS